MATGDYVWYTWATSSTTSSSATCEYSTSEYTSVDDSYVWQTWTSTSATCTADSTTDGIWLTWVEEDSTGSHGSRVYQGTQVVTSKPLVVPEVKRETTEERRARRVQAEISRQWSVLKARELEEQKAEAERVAQELLGDLIGPEHLETYRRTGRLFVRGAQNDYIINKGGLVDRLTRNKVIPMCVHLDARYAFPETDNVAGLALMLQDPDTERVILEKANHRTPRDRAELREAACL